MSEFARPIDTTRLPRGESVRDIAATAAERQALARRFDLVSLERLEATVRLRPLADGSIRLAARITAEATQTCVVTLDPVAARIEEEFTLRYAPAEDEDDVALDSEVETVEPLIGDVIDIGEAVAQQLSLALDPYPHAPGSES
jgi:uncharacterized metal-binding protein YceD (DUF177 family)